MSLRKTCYVLFRVFLLSFTFFYVFKQHLLYDYFHIIFDVKKINAVPRNQARPADLQDATRKI